MNNTKVPVAILVRVSTTKQETARQISELEQYAANHYTDTMFRPALDKQKNRLIGAVVFE